MASGSPVTSVPWKNVQTRMDIITTGIGEHCGIGTLKKCENQNVHHTNGSAPTSSHLKSFLEPAVPPIRLFLMINMMPLKKFVVKGNYFTALLRNEARNKFLMSRPWLSLAKLRPLSFAAARWGCLYLLL